MNIYRIIVADTDYSVLDSLGGHLAAHGYEVFLATSGADVIELAAEQGCHLALVELDLPDVDGLAAAERLTASVADIAVTLMGAPDTVEQHADRLLGSEFSCLQKPISPAQALLAVERAARVKRLKDENRMLRRDWEEHEGPDDLVSQTPVMVDVLRQAATAAEDDSPVVICGPPGTEKDIVALYIHRCSQRADGPFIRFECGHNRPHSEEAELFGREYHGSNGAVWRGSGRLDLAAGGTLLLDRVEDLSPRCQAKLLRFIEEGLFTRAETDQLGRAAADHLRRGVPTRADVRIICAFSGDGDAARSDRLREDLLFRLNELSITIPPLAQRRKDIVPLARRLVERFGLELSKGVTGISPEAERLLEDYDWPGNLAELKDTIRTAVLGAQHTVLAPEDLLRGPSRRVISGVIGGVTGPTLEDAERQLILKTLTETRGNKSEAARRLRISTGTLNNKLARYQASGLVDGARNATKKAEKC
ncbi:MAG: sigma-54-dependent transcriptional regulator [Planctomycetota bacterium]